MQPETVHLCMQLIRHSRGILSSFERWVLWVADQQPPQEPAQSKTTLTASTR